MKRLFFQYFQQLRAQWQELGNSGSAPYLALIGALGLCAVLYLFTLYTPQGALPPAPAYCTPLGYYEMAAPMGAIRIVPASSWQLLSPSANGFQDSTVQSANP